MRQIFFAGFCILAFGSCTNSDKKSKFDNISSTDTTCIKAVKRAKEDISKGELSFCYHTGSLLYEPVRCEEEIDSILTLLGIGYRNVMTSDVVYEGQTQGCYGDYMNEVILRRFGNHFIDSIMYKADSIFVSKNPNKVFNYHDCDTDPVFPGDSSDDNRNFNPGLQIAFDSKVTYPEGYIRKTPNDKLGFVNLNLLIDKQGNAEIQQFSFVFDNDKNLQFQKHFKNIYEPIIKGTKWIPATIKKQNVSSTITAFVYLK
ncbi:hypothetical protein A3860_36630 [Niastella vici]|uniref:Uncharacterized protein n=1 Tax=Niastella vici TaxID=1703345 RepID=A0A1V9FMM9_9BACT|nr:hypothetical protein [Niastella vici]OQP59609.1 hypothetical protein A3860_36630 [Niastella vici]